MEYNILSKAQDNFLLGQAKNFSETVEKESKSLKM